MRNIPPFLKEVPFFVVLLVALACIIGPVAGEDESTVPPETLAPVETVTNTILPVETETPPDAALVLSIAADPPDGPVPLTVRFTGTATGPAVDIWEWTIDGVAAGNGPDLTHTFTGAGTYTVALTATNASAHLANTTSIEIVAEEETPLMIAARAGVIHPRIWNVSKIEGSGNVTSLWEIGDQIGDGDTIRIWGMAESAADRVYESGITINVPDVMVKQWEGSPAQPLIAGPSAVGPSAVATMSPGPSAPAFAVTADNTTFRGLNISGNAAGIYAAGDPEDHIRGLTIAECTFVGNGAIGGPSVNPGGGALYAEYVDDLRVERTEFTENSAEYGGGAYFSGCDNARLADTIFTDNNAAFVGGGAVFEICENATVTGTAFTENEAEKYGGGAYFWGCANPTLTDATFTGNNATSGGVPTVVPTVASRGSEISGCGGGAYFSGCGNARLADTIFTGNNATRGGGIYATGNVEVRIRGLTIADCTFTGNAANGDAAGGALYARYVDDLRVERTEFTNNTANEGGGAYFGDCENAMLTRTTFENNRAEYFGSEPALGPKAASRGPDCVGGGAYFNRCNNATVTDSVFTCNNATYGGGAAFGGCEEPTITCTMFTGNAAEELGGGAVFGGCDNATVTDTIFIHNTAIFMGGGAVFESCENATVTGTAFTENDATNGGGAAFGWCEDTTITGTTFIGNTATDHDVELRSLESSEDELENSGGAVYFYCCEDTAITNCRFDNPTNIYAEDDFEARGSEESDIMERFSAVLNTTRTSGTNIAGGPYLGGNLWLTDPAQNISEWCADADFDGICDEPLTIAMNNGEEFGTDYLPLVYGGTVAIASTPAGASVHLDGRTIGHTTGTSLYLPVGDHTITVTLDGYVTPAHRVVTVVPGETVPVSFALEPVSPPSGSGGGRSDLSAASAGQILTGGNASLTFPNRAIYEIRVTAGETIQTIFVTIERSGLPSGVDAPAGTIFEYDEVTIYHTTDDAIEGALILFSIPKAWLAESGLDPADVVLYRYHDGAWQALPTEVVDEDATSWHFSARSPGFSLFAIGGDPAPVEIKAPDAGAQAGTTEPLPPVTSVEPASPPAETPQPFPTMILLLCVAAVILIAAVFLWKRR
ncbi:MAG: PGF-pre-PGF domain-containing protein [Methanofollis sp.]|uniref:PGF-pre-PGF domain-containing protein n=1 Tax=Methanofollis sp. TaxID=2052835 RepID=UPI002625D4A1|nr:PGF-pre-PGF domain-containing protein [Methanofollis sp.]MDD4254846.1 PGF-pre-PGF domain-containing protein [Methanofollis sp.]